MVVLAQRSERQRGLVLGTSHSDALRPQRNAGIFTYGGDTRIRTEDLLNANQALYQLSYIPT